MLLANEQAYINTAHPDFVGGLGAVREFVTTEVMSPVDNRYPAICPPSTEVINALDKMLIMLCFFHCSHLQVGLIF